MKAITENPECARDDLDPHSVMFLQAVTSVKMAFGALQLKIL